MDLRMYVNGERVTPPTGTHLALDSNMDRTRPLLVRRLPGEIPGSVAGSESFPVALPAGAVLAVYDGDRLVATFKERGGIAVDPVELLTHAKASEGS